MNDAHRSNITDAVAATKEEIELEAVVNIVGGPKAQRAVQEHRLPQLVSTYMGGNERHENGHGNA